MDPSDFIGFIISLLALAYLFIRNRSQARQRREHPEMYKGEDEQEDALREFLKSMDMPVDEKPKPVVRRPEAIQPKVKKVNAHSKPWKSDIEERRMHSEVEQRRLKSAIDDRRLKTVTEERRLESALENRYADPYGETDVGKNAPSYEVIQGPSQRSRVQRILEELPTKKQIVILNEILNRPKGFL